MSILLDAVTKGKQQQMGELPDAVLTPRAPYKAANTGGWLSQLWGKILVLIFVVLFGVLLAWGLSTLFQPAALQSAVIKPIAVQTSADLAVQQPVSQGTGSTSRVNRDSTSRVNDSPEFRIANKVALPIAKAQNSINSSINTSTRNASRNEPVNEQQYEYRLNESNRGQVSSLAASQTKQDSEQLTVPQTPNANSNISTRSAGNNTSNKERQLTAEELKALYGDDAIILGANSNYKKASDLNALQMKVTAAAENVNFEQENNQTPQVANQLNQDQSNNLLAAFEAALKDVEYESSANQSVTEPSLDPIPKTKKDDIPKYGELPASVQLQVPEFNIQAHVYSSDATNRWLNVDGAELQEGDMISGKLKIIEIRPRDVVLEIDGSEFKVPAI
ncbi:general secretion pathway protein GspB [Shewanella donghaensis]|uniref:general secretion pathway protein GspB n=1 Tax=Shewanella donghaensis TaxID=238836 RepID=UPI001182237B|nr:general secretion pathway protein GspB [Shewanella donghaensis]